MLVNEVMAGRLVRAYNRLFGIQSDTPTPTLASEFQPVHQMGFSPEERFLMGEKLMGVAAQVTAAVGFPSIAVFDIAPTLNLVAVIEDIVVSTDTTNGLYLLMRNYSATGYTAVVPDPRDYRAATASATGPSAMRVTQSNASAFAVGSDELARVIMQVGVPWRFGFPIVLTPGSRLVIRTADQVQLNYSVQWRERPLQPEERAV